MGVHPSGNHLDREWGDNGIAEGGQLAHPVYFPFEEERKRPFGAKAIQEDGNPMIQATKIDASAPDAAVLAGGVGADEEVAVPRTSAWSFRVTVALEPSGLLPAKVVPLGLDWPPLGVVGAHQPARPIAASSFRLEAPCFPPYLLHL